MVTEAPEWLSLAWRLLLLGVIPLVLFAENLAPRHPDHPRRGRRWINNLLLGLSFWWVSREALLLAAAGTVLWSGIEPPGVLARIPLPPLLALGVALLVIDLCEYLLHRLYHRVPLLWRLHRVHHSDTRVDVTTTLRQHPLGALVDVPLQLGIWFLLGVAPLAVLLYQFIALAVHLFSHANWQLPATIERRLRGWLVTPDFHVVHHSRERIETDSNYGSVLPWWDHLFATAQVRDAAACRSLVLGLDEFRADRDLWLPRLLGQPFQTMSRAGLGRGGLLTGRPSVRLARQGQPDPE